MQPGERVILRGEGARVIATPDRLFRAEINPKSLDHLFRVGEIPEELQQEATKWISAVLSIAGIETDIRNDREDRNFTRRALIARMKRLRQQVARGIVTRVPTSIEDHLLEIETARLRHGLGDRWWGPVVHITLDEYLEVHRVAVERVKKCRGDSVVLFTLLEDAIRTLDAAPERTTEVMARRGRQDTNISIIVRNVAFFWTKKLGRRPDNLKGMTALADVVWGLLGQRKSPEAIREAFARHVDWSAL